MAQLILSNIGEALGSRVAPAAFRGLGAAIGRTAGAYIGASIDARVFGGTRRFESGRLTDLHVQGSTEGASIPAIYGRVRIAGEVIWAARFKEHVEKHETGGKGGGPRAVSTEYTYSLSFAVGLCEGEIARIGRAWANGEPLDLSQVAWRLYTGGEDQMPDPLIEAIEGADHAPAYRGLAYVVFEDLPLESFGNVIPQLSFEVIRPAPRQGGAPPLEDLVKGVCLIPGAGEFVYAAEPVYRVTGPGQEAPENVHAEKDRANLLVSLDQLQADFPNCDSVLLVVAWFGDDLRCGECAIRPGVEIAEKETAPLTWRAGGVERAGAHLVSAHDGAPAFGGTPCDASVIQAIQALKARGFQVGLYPFVLMDVPADNALPDPYGGDAQAAYPWRGRITVHPAAGQPDSPDKTSAAAAQIAAFFGAAAPADFGGDARTVSYDGPDEWSYRRFILHNAKLAALAGGVDVFLLGSELRGVTTARDAPSAYPAVAALQALASDVRAMLGGGTIITYGADWSEYFGHQPADGSGDVFFHLDPLWADANIDVVGVDYYAPLTDWRDGDTHLDASLARDEHDGAYLQSRIEAGENYEWYYASDADRSAQIRTAISDGAYAEPWIFRAKDVRNFWARAHHDRPGGVRSGTPTAWTAQSKPIWFMELGCPAVDKGANAPNLFVDPKSSESALPPFSSGARDDLIQRRTLEAYLRYWSEDAETNPVSDVYDAPMLGRVFLWTWDARPYAAFPARADVWADGGQWRLGHWLNGRAGLSGLGEVVADICARAGVSDADVSGLLGAVSGYVADSPATARAALEPLMAAYAFSAREREGRLSFFHAAAADPVALTLDDFGADSVGDRFAQRTDAAETPIEARVRFLDGARDYLIGSVSARRLDRAEGGVETLEAPLVLETEAAEMLAQRLLAARRAEGESVRFDLGPAQLALEPGDRVTFPWSAEVFEIARIEDAETRVIEAQRALGDIGAALNAGDPATPPTPTHAPTPAFSVLDLPPLPGAEDDERPLAAVFASPWTGGHDVYAGASDALATRRARVLQPAAMGELLWALWPGPVDRWDEGNRIRIRLYGGALASVTKDALLNGANAFAIESDDGEWEIVQARNAVLVGEREWELSGFLRGQQGSAHAMRAPHPVGTRIVALDARLARVDVASHEWGEALAFVVPPAGALSTDARALRLAAALPHAAARPWAPAHVRARRDASGDVTISWIRCARAGGDFWGSGEPPLGAPTESYALDILDGDDLKRSVTVAVPSYLYSAAEQTVDFGGAPGSIRVRVAQLDAGGAPGLKSDLNLPLY
ncbi:MAG TPA: glycoside hydrolase/phage tail family protein [Caulobacterales bacterium]|nr:glycoside hydrolase/phage tail family protein [Caulobacterales bacterium]